MKFFLLLNILLLILFIYWMTKDLKKKPSKLNFKKKKTVDYTSFEDVLKNKEQNNDQYEKVLNVLFQYNGETWDAYEVLGLPAGASVEDAHKAFDTISPKRKGEIEFLQQALNAILSVRR